MQLHILGLPTGHPALWTTEGPPPRDGTDLAALLEARFPELDLQILSRGLDAAHRESSTRPEHLDQDQWQRVMASPALTLIARPRCRDRSPTSGAAVQADAGPGRTPGPEMVLVTETGPDAGRIVPLTRQGLSVGRGRADWQLSDPALSQEEAHIGLAADQVQVSRNGACQSWDGGRVLALGSSTLRLHRGAGQPLTPCSEVPELQVEAPPEPSRPSLVLQAVMAASPLAIGVVMAVVTGLWYFLLFSLVSVIITTVMGLQHRRAQREHGREITQRVAHLVHRLETLHPTPGAYALAARASAPDRFGVQVAGAAPTTPGVCWGTATLTVPVTGIGTTTVARTAALQRWSRTRVPATGATTRSETAQETVVTGEPAELRSAARWALLQLLRHAQTSDQAVRLHAEDGQQHVWSSGRDQGGGTLLDLSGGATPPPSGWHWIRFLTHESAGASQERGATGQMDWVDLTEGVCFLSGNLGTDLNWWGVSSDTLSWLVSEMDGPASVDGSADSADQGPLLLAAPHPLDVPTTAPPASAVQALRVELSGGRASTVLDLVRDGPHILVTGTTGSGKSELLLTLLVGLAAHHAPSELSYLLLDFKGGSSFAVLQDLPHTMSVETNLTDACSMRTLDALRAELRRREELFLASGVPDYAAFRQAHPEQLLPRLVVAVDELRVLVDEHPASSAVLMRLAATGRSLGFHLVLAAQRAQGAVGPDVRSNLGSIICLRTATEQESWDMLGGPQAAALPSAAPGWAYLKRGGEEPELFRSGRFVLRDRPTSLRPVLEPSSPGALDRQDAPGHTGSLSNGEEVNWPGVVTQVGELVRQHGLPVPSPAVLPELPELWTGPPTSSAKGAGRIPLALVDQPTRHLQGPLWWHPFTDGSLAWIGTEAGGLQQTAQGVHHALGLPEHRGAWGDPVLVRLDAQGWLPPAQDPALDSAGLGASISRLQEAVNQGRTALLLITGWGALAQQRAGEGFETVEDRLTALLRDAPAGRIAAAVFGGRELAGSRLLGQLPTRFFVPCGTSPEHRMVWPTLTPVREIPGRAVLVSPEHPAPGAAAQLTVLNQG